MAIQRIPEFITVMKKAHGESNIQLLCDVELRYLRNAYSVSNEPDELGKYQGLATYKRAITNYRKAIFLLDKKHLARDFFKMSKEDAQNMKYQDGKSAMLNYKNRMEGNVFTIKNPNEYIQTSIQLLSATSYIDNILGLAALTGRRVNEIGHSSEFDYCEYDDIYNAYHLFDEMMDLEALDMLTVFGLSKKQTYLNDKETDDTGIIPILCDGEIVINAMNELRKRKTFESADDFHNKASKDLSKKVKIRYGEYLGDKCTSHDLRKAYARLAYDFMVYEAVQNDDGLVKFAGYCLGQKVPDNYMKFSKTK